MTVLWEHRLIWQDYVIEVRHTCGWSGMTGFDHLNITVLSPERAAIPITETGYKSHFLDEREVILAGGGLPMSPLGSTKPRIRPNGKSTSANPVNYRSFER